MGVISFCLLKLVKKLSSGIAIQDEIKPYTKKVEQNYIIVSMETALHHSSHLFFKRKVLQAFYSKINNHVVHYIQ